MNPWTCVVGNREDGRQVALRAVVDRLHASGRRVGGFLQEPADGGYDLVSMIDGRRLAIARPSATPELCDLGFEQAAFDEAKAWVCAPRLDVVVLELGILEAAGQGHWLAMKAALEAPPRLLLVGIRPRALASIALALPDPVAGLELPAPATDLETFASEVVSAARAD